MATGHGNTPAAWTGVAIMTIGCLVGAVGIIIAAVWLLFVGLGIVALGAIVGFVMALMGLGAARDERDPQRGGRPQHAAH